MRHIRNLAVLFFLCMLSLFFVMPDIQYVAAFLCALILCCTDQTSAQRHIPICACLAYFSAAVSFIDFLWFYPLVFYIVSRRQKYLFFFPGAVLFFLLALRYSLPMPVICTEGFAFFTAFLLALETNRGERLEAALCKVKDDSTERDLLLTEKNRSLLEKQDYEIYTATLRERNRIAREIHDNVGHLLSRSILLTGAAKAVNKNGALCGTLDSLDATLSLAMDNIRQSVHDLHDEAVNLEEALQSLIRDFTFCPVQFTYDCGKSLPKELKYSFISITKEALSNIIRHSRATAARITVREHPALYQLCIEDNGGAAASDRSTSDGSVSGGSASGGLESDRPELDRSEFDRSDRPGIGLSNMKERVLKLNGNIRIITDNGFKILITIPKEKTT